MRPVPPLLLLRHGETDWNRGRRLQGQRDVALNALGRRQGARNGRTVAPLLPGRDWRFVASPLSRTCETMRLALEACGRGGEAFDTDPRLLEVSFGRWEGLTWEEIKAQRPAEAAARRADKWSYVPEGGESYAAMSLRVADWLRGLDGPTLVAAHGGTMRALLHLLAGVPAREAPHHAAPQDRVLAFANGSVFFL